VANDTSHYTGTTLHFYLARVRAAGPQSSYISSGGKVFEKAKRNIGDLQSEPNPEMERWLAVTRLQSWTEAIDGWNFRSCGGFYIRASYYLNTGLHEDIS
jgi:hypothetical protein